MPLFEKINIKYIDHFAVTTNSFAETLQSWMALPNSKLIKGPGNNKTQQVEYAFVKLDNGTVVEILAPISDTSPICNHIESGGGLYHTCFAVDDLNKSVELAVEYGAKVVVKPVEDVAFNSKKIAFLIHSAHGLFELVETGESTPEVKDDAIEKRVARVIAKLFPDTKNMQASTVKYGCTHKWDSLGQLRVIMEIESEFEVKVPVEEVAKLSSLAKLVSFIENR